MAQFLPSTIPSADYSWTRHWPHLTMHGRKEKKPSVRRTEALFILRKEAELARIVSKYKDRLCFHPPSPWENFKGRENINITKNFCPYLQLANLRSCNCDKQADPTEWKVIRAIKAEGNLWAVFLFLCSNIWNIPTKVQLDPFVPQFWSRTVHFVPENASKIFGKMRDPTWNIWTWIFG